MPSRSHGFLQGIDWNPTGAGQTPTWKITDDASSLFHVIPKKSSVRLSELQGKLQGHVG
jgi:hypothetical protein